MVRKSKRFRFTRRLTLISTAAVVVIVAAGLGIWHYHDRPSQEVIPSTHSGSSITTNDTASQPASGSTSSDKQGAAASGSSVPTNTQNPTNGTGQAPATPTGNFVSNHKPGGIYPTTEQSACNTTPGASCYIKFTNGNQTKTLDTQTTNSNGAAIWSWDAAAFPAGTWQITAVATLNGQTKTAEDATNLTVQ